MCKCSDNVLSFIQKCVVEQKIRWPYHVNMRMKDRFISRQSIVESYANYEIIEEYPNDKYLPSYLVRSSFNENVFHILFAIDAQGDNIRIITAYSPNPEEWEDNFTKRRHL